MTDTQPFMHEARKLAFNICPFDEDDEKCAFRAAKWGIIATALSSAYQRGREDAAKIVDQEAEERYALSNEGHARVKRMGLSAQGFALTKAATAIRTERE